MILDETQMFLRQGRQEQFFGRAMKRRSHLGEGFAATFDYGFPLTFGEYGEGVGMVFFDVGRYDLCGQAEEGGWRSEDCFDGTLGGFGGLFCGSQCREILFGWRCFDRRL